MGYSLVFKYEKMKCVYLCGTDELGNPLHTDDESKALKFDDIDEAFAYYCHGYGVITKIHGQ